MRARGPGLTARSWGEKSGAESVVLSESQIPNHTHALIAIADDERESSSVRRAAFRALRRLSGLER